MAKRITIALDDQLEKMFEGLRSLSESISTVEVIRKAVSLYDFAQRTLAKGGKVLIEDKDGKQYQVDIK